MLRSAAGGVAREKGGDGMNCPNCGCWSPPDRETGYDADELCPSCKAELPDQDEPGPDQKPIEKEQEVKR